MKNITMQPIWDADCLKKCEHAAMARMKTAQFAEDQERALTEAARRVSNAIGQYFECRSARCRRARRCVSNQAFCTLVFARELEPEEMQRSVGKAYLRIQQERRTAAYERRPPLVTDAVTNYKPRKS
jgi:hypothetical protein